jgi:type III pantothenate kinase
MILLIDIGNTRLKWAELRDGVLSSQAAFAHSGIDRARLLQEMQRNVARPERVLISNVGGAEIGAACVSAIRSHWNIEPELVVSSAYAAGVTSAYREPEKLGVDRWLAMIAAHAVMPTALCVVSVGTAMTIDGVEPSGRHLGGLIVPGPELMVSSLLKNTSDIAPRATQVQMSDELFADHTFGAIHQGARHALAALVDRAIIEIERTTNSRPHVMLTGGASEHIAPLLESNYEVVPDLVLRGLATIADQLRSP